MQGVSGVPFSNRRALVDLSRPRPLPLSDPFVHRQRVRRELKEAGLSGYAMSQPESRYLPRIIHPDEHIGGAVFGRHEFGLVMLVATDRRIVFLDKKPLFVDADEINYVAVNGVDFGHVGIGCTVNLHTRVKDYRVRSFNARAAGQFVHYIEGRCLEHLSGDGGYGQA